MLHLFLASFPAVILVVIVIIIIIVAVGISLIIIIFIVVITLETIRVIIVLNTRLSQYILDCSHCNHHRYVHLCDHVQHLCSSSNSKILVPGMFSWIVEIVLSGLKTIFKARPNNGRTWVVCFVLVFCLSKVRYKYKYSSNQ